MIWRESSRSTGTSRSSASFSITINARRRNLQKQAPIQFRGVRYFKKGVNIGMGRDDDKRYNDHLRDLIVRGRIKPSKIVSHRLPLRDAPDAFAEIRRALRRLPEDRSRPEIRYCLKRRDSDRADAFLMHGKPSENFVRAKVGKSPIIRCTTGC